MPSGMFSRDRATFEFDLSFRRSGKPGDQLEQRRFSAAGRPDNGEEFALFEFEVDRPERMHRLPACCGGKHLVSRRAASHVPRTRDNPPVRGALISLA